MLRTPACTQSRRKSEQCETVLGSRFQRLDGGPFSGLSDATPKDMLQCTITVCGLWWSAPLVLAHCPSVRPCAATFHHAYMKGAQLPLLYCTMMFECFVMLGGRFRRVGASARHWNENSRVAEPLGTQRQQSCFFTTGLAIGSIFTRVGY